MNIYQNCLDLIHTYIYGGATLTADMSLVAVTLATCATVFTFALPFLLVWKIIKSL